METTQVFVQDPALSAKFSNVIGQMKKHKNAHFFTGAVDQTMYPTYTTIVKKPMDIYKLELNMSTYRSGAEFLGMPLFIDVLADARLIRDNCKAFNGEKANISIWAAQITRLAEKAFLEKSVCIE